SSNALSLDPGNNDRKEELSRAIKEYQVLRAWLEARLKKWNLYKTEPGVPTKVTAVPADKRIDPDHPAKGAFPVTRDFGGSPKHPTHTQKSRLAAGNLLNVLNVLIWLIASC
ncbi:MAG TPA: hypothetical protein VGK21_19550, partial [Candidatus Angelobacter sp.]